MNIPREIQIAVINEALSHWQWPSLPSCFSNITAKSAEQLLSHRQAFRLIKSTLSSNRDKRATTRLQLSAIDWLYEAIRLNIKRGHLFELDHVLSEGRADCLGYAKVFHLLGRRMGLDTGIVEVLIDNAGRFVPHIANIVRLADKRQRFVDLWYGSTNIHHLRLGLMVKQNQRWHIIDADRKQLSNFSDIKGLTTRCIDAITCYMIGNRHLERGIRLQASAEFEEAIHYYTTAIRLYPQNARFYFNRAIAYENAQNKKAAGADYAIALSDEAGLIRVQGRLYDEIVRLTALDEAKVDTKSQDMYLLHKGFVTGRSVPLERISAKYQLPADEVKKVISRIEASILSTTEHHSPGSHHTDPSMAMP